MFLRVEEGVVWRMWSFRGGVERRVNIWGERGRRWWRRTTFRGGKGWVGGGWGGGVRVGRRGR